MTDELAVRLKISEIFCSIQGESTHAGKRCAFIRLTGCHLRCSYCDTEYSFTGGRWMSVQEILESIAEYRCPMVEVTGGEPLLQPGVYPLLDALLGQHETVLLETSGALSIAQVDPRVVRILDLKTPSSGEVERNCWDNIELLTPRDEVKFVIGDRDDYDWSVSVVRKYELLKRCPVLFSPVVGLTDSSAYTLYKGGLAPAELAGWIISDRLDVRFSYQLHKIIWEPTARGV